MRPEFFLIGDFKSIIIFLHDTIYDSFVLDIIQSTGRIHHLAADFECMHGTFEKSLLQIGNLANTFDVPIFRRVGSLVERPFATARRIEQDAVKNLAIFFPLLSRIERHADVHTRHAFEVLQELWDALARRLVRDDKTLWKIFRELCRLAAGTRRHIEYQKTVGVNSVISKERYRMRRSQFLDIKIPDKMIQRITNSAFDRIKILSAVEAVHALDIGRLENPSVRFQMRDNGCLHSWSCANRTRNRGLERIEESRKFLLIARKEVFVKVCLEAGVDHRGVFIVFVVLPDPDRVP